MTGDFAGRRVIVIGAGVAGAAAAEALVVEGADVLVSESRLPEALDALPHLRELGVDVATGGHDPSHLEGATLVVTSPGVPQDAPILTWARESGIPVWGELELGARLCGVPYLAVTGTNGKTTTTGLIASCLRAAGHDAVACGNIGHPFPLAAREGHDVLVVEASSFQLRFIETFHPKVSVLLNLAPDHVDWHGSEQAYVDAKRNIVRAQGEGDTHVGNRDDARAAAVSLEAPCPVAWFTRGAPDDGEVGYIGGTLVARVAGSESLGPVDGERAGYREDVAAAAAASLAFGVTPDAIRRGIASFTPAHHRGEVVALVDGVRFVDNSKATNVHAALAALEGVRGAVLIAGGRAKGVDLSPLRDGVDGLAGVVALGESAREVGDAFDGLVPVHYAATIEEATAEAFALSPRPGTVLLAPACASWDMFRDYAERGDRFAAAARALMQEVGADG